MAQLYARDEDHERLKKLAKRETRQPVYQITVILDAYCDQHGLDRETVEPINTEATKLAS